MKIPEIIVKSITLEIGSLNLLPLINILKDKDNISEFKLAEKLETTVNSVRNLLYKLQEYNLVSFTRKKDKKKGWFIYYWTLDKKSYLLLGSTLKTAHITTLKKRLLKEKNNQFFICVDKCVRFDTQNAMEYNYTCPECGKILVEKSNKKEVLLIEKAILRLETRLGEINELLKGLQEKEQKKKNRATKKVKKEMDQKKEEIKIAKSKAREQKKLLIKQEKEKLLNKKEQKKNPKPKTRPTKKSKKPKK